jgi:hypothetical protein
MKTRLPSATQWLGVPLSSVLAIMLSIVVIAATGLVFCPGAQCQSPSALIAPVPKESKHRKHAPPPDQGPHPGISIPVTPLGFAPPAPFYLGDRLAQVSLNFIDEDKLLFTFRIPGLIAREHTAAGQNSTEAFSHEERNIRAVVLSLPSGKVTAEAVWRLHDFSRYLWVLKDHRFFLRDRNLVQTGDASLHLEPFLRFPGLVKSIELDPGQQLLVANTVEPPAPEVKEGDQSESKPKPNSEVASTSSAGVFRMDDAGDSKPESQRLLRILRMEDGKVLLFTRLDHGIVHLPVDGEGYYDAIRGNGLNWLISYRDFSGSDNPILTIESICYPSLDVMAPGLVLASACATDGGRRLTALTRTKHRLWEVSTPPTWVWPVLVQEGPRLARATLNVTHPIGPSAPLDRDDIRGQNVQVYDLATGRVALTVPASPVLDGGGGFALSPSGRRLAVLNAGAIQIFDLPPAPPLAPEAPAHP